MADQNTVICAPDNCKIKIIKWRVREGFPVGCAQVILMYQICDTDDKEIKKLRACNAGVVKKRLFKEGATVEKGCALVSLSTCIHTTVVKDMCADCGADLRQDEKGNTPEASVPMVHSIPDLKVSEKLAQKLGRADTKRLLQDKKLVLLVDLDQTIIHTTNDNVPNNIKGIYHFQLYGPHSRWYHTRLRPGTRNFLEQMSQYYELHICTFGARNYAHTIAQLLDPDGKFFSHRILSRDECFNATSKTDNLKALFPCGDSMVCIIDDREDVWNMASNLIQVKPYHFFQHTGDINAPPEVSKHELDGEGIDFKDLQKLSGSEEIFFKKLDGNKEGYAINETKAAVKEESKKKSEDKEATKDPTTTASIPDGNTQNSDSDKKEDDSVIEPPAKIRKEDEPQTKTLKENESPAKINNENESSATIRKENELPTKTSKANELQIKLSKENEPSAKNSIGNETSKDDPPKSKITSENPGKLIDIEDPDDYLLYLESILINIHSRFYEIYNKINEIPDLKIIVPKIRSEVLRKKNLVFSGLVPTNMKLEQSRAYFIAKSLGAEVSQNINEHTTHLVAVTSGTFKVNAARKNPKIKIVNANWLWSCAERWENVDERMFPLDKKNNNQQRQPPAHCHSPEHVVNYSEKSEISSSSSMQELEPEKFIDTINPLLSFSNADLADMNKEFDQFFESDSSSEDEHRNFENPPEDKVLRKRKRQEKEEERQRKFFSHDEEITFEKKDATENEENSSVEEEDDEMPSTKFRRGEHLPSDLEMGSGSDDNSETRDVEDDGDWNMMGAALEREFLGLED